MRDLNRPPAFAGSQARPVCALLCCAYRTRQACRQQSTQRTCACAAGVWCGVTYHRMTRGAASHTTIGCMVRRHLPPLHNMPPAHVQSMRVLHMHCGCRPTAPVSLSPKAECGAPLPPCLLPSPQRQMNVSCSGRAAEYIALTHCMRAALHVCRSL